MDVLLIFLKNPVPGQVKTRLARTVGDGEAVRIYRFLLRKTRQAALEAPVVRRWLFYADQPPNTDDGWPSALFDKAAQCAGNLGARMADAFQRAFAAGATRTVIIGSDCPELDGEQIGKAFAALEEADLVLGPTPDGGYYLLGMRQFHPELFANIAWSTPEVLSQTLKAAQQKGLCACLLQPLADIDTEADWKAYQARCRP